MVDLSFRRPGFAPQDEYLTGRYIHEILALNLEASITRQVTGHAAALEKAGLQRMATAARASHAARQRAGNADQTSSMGTL